MITTENNELLENFDKDRNILLKKAQESLFNFLSGYLIKKAIDKYESSLQSTWD